MEGHLNRRYVAHGAIARPSRRDPRLRSNGAVNLRPVDVIVCISKERLKEVLPGLFWDKVILVFAGSWTPAQAEGWIRAFNGKSATKLTYSESLVNFLFIAFVEEHPGGLSRLQLAEKVYHQASEQFATINLYPTAFDPQNPLDFKYLITIRIRKGTLDMFSLLDDILAHIRVVADRDIASGHQHHMIIALVSTQLRTFTHNALVPLDNDQVLHVKLDVF